MVNEEMDDLIFTNLNKTSIVSNPLKIMNFGISTKSMENIAFRKISQKISSKLLFKIVDILMGLKNQLLKNCNKFQNIGQNGDFRFFVQTNYQANSLGSKLSTYSRNSRSL